MPKTVTLRDANQNFSEYVRQVEAGEVIVVTRRGKPVVKLSPVSGRRVLTPEQQAARRRALVRMKKGWPLGIGKLDRDSLYDR
ncbi:MAG: type II toxin-antitoxin system Phd/YefM family antitoxin [Dongiaceae bacterium]